MGLKLSAGDVVRVIHDPLDPNRGVVLVKVEDEKQNAVGCAERCKSETYDQTNVQQVGAAVRGYANSNPNLLIMGPGDNDYGRKPKMGYGSIEGVGIPNPEYPNFCSKCGEYLGGTFNGAVNHQICRTAEYRDAPNNAVQAEAAHKSIIEDLAHAVTFSFKDKELEIARLKEENEELRKQRKCLEEQKTNLASRSHSCNCYKQIDEARGLAIERHEKIKLLEKENEFLRKERDCLQHKLDVERAGRESEREVLIDADKLARKYKALLGQISERISEKIK